MVLTSVLSIVLLTWSQAARAEHLSQSAHRPASCDGTFDIHVVDVLDHTPIASAVVTLGDVVGTTDPRGHTLLENVCAGPGLLEVFHPSYESQSRSIQFDKDSTAEVRLQPQAEEFVIEQKRVRAPDMRSTTEVVGDALERTRGQSLAEAIGNVPGVTQLRSGTGLGKPVVRGHFGRRVPLLVDGVRHRSQDWGIDHTPEIDPNMADRITVVRGAAGVRYGSDAIGGVVVVDPPEVLPHPGVAGELHLLGYSNGLGAGAAGRLQVAPIAVPGLSVGLDGSAKRLRSPSTPDYPLDNTGEAEWSGGVTAQYLTGGARYQLTLRHFETQLGVCACYRIETAGDFAVQLQRQRPNGSELYRSDAQIERPYQSVSHELALARARWTMGPFGSLTATYALQFDLRREYDVVRQATVGPQFLFQLWTHDADLTFEHRPMHVTDHLHLNGTMGVVGMVQDHSYSGLSLVPSHHAVGTGVFASERLWGEDYELELGVRYDHLFRSASIEDRDFLRLARSGQISRNACGHIDGAQERTQCESAFNTVSVSLGGLLRLGQQWAAKLDLSTASRPPNPDEQYLNGSAPSFPVLGLGKPDAGAETSFSASSSLVFSGKNVSGELSGFGSYISDYLYFAPATTAQGQPIFDVLIRGTFPRFVTRAVDAIFYGADGYLSTKPFTWLVLGAQASLVRARNTADNSYLVFVPPDRVRASATIARPSLGFLKRGFATVAGSYTARQSRFDINADLAPPPSGYFLAEASLGAQLPVSQYTLKFALQGTNVLGARYREYTSLMRYFADQPDRQIMLRMTIVYGHSTT